MAKDLHFSKDVIMHRGPSTLAFKDYDQAGLFDSSSVIQRQKHGQVTEKKETRPRKLKPLMLESKKSATAPAKQTSTNVPFCLEECIWKAKMECAESSLFTPIPPCDPPQTLLTESLQMLGDSTIQKSWSKRKFHSIATLEPEYKDLGWEEILLLKLNKTTAQWIVNNQGTWGGWVHSKPKSFKKQKYDWNRIRYVLPFDCDVKLLDEIMANEAEIPMGSFEEKKVETLLPAYYR